MGNYEWAKGLRAGVTQILTLILTAVITAVLGVLSDSEAIREVLLNAGVNEAYVGVLLLLLAGVVRFAQNYRKHRPPTPTTTNAGPLILLALLPSLASAQDAPKATPSEAALHCGAMQFAERGQQDKRDFVCRLSLTVPAPSGITIFGRADYTRDQDGGDLLDIKTFRSVETFIGGRKDIAPNLSATVFSGVTWDRDADIQPADPRLWTLAGGLRYTVPGRGYVIAAAGHHGPVGGSAFLGSLVYQVSESASWFGDIAVPLDASRFAQRPYTIKAGVSARIKGWKF